MNVVVSPKHNRSEFTADSNCSFSVERGSEPGTVLLWVRSPNRVASFLGPTMEISVQPFSRTTGDAAAVVARGVNPAPVRSPSVAVTSLTPSATFNEAPPLYANVTVSEDTGPATPTSSHNGTHSPSNQREAHPTPYSFETADANQGSTDAQQFEVLVESMDGQKFTMQARGSMTVSQFKEKYFDISGRPPDQTRLVHAGKQLEDQWTLSDCGVKKGSFLFVVFRLRGS